MACSVAAVAVRVLFGDHMPAQAEPAALAGARGGFLAHFVRGGHDEFAVSPSGSLIVVEPVMLVQARLLVGVQVPVGVDVRRIVDVALVVGTCTRRPCSVAWDSGTKVTR
jgi:hypothetical protein